MMCETSILDGSNVFETGNQSWTDLKDHSQPFSVTCERDLWPPDFNL